MSGPSAVLLAAREQTTREFLTGAVRGLGHAVTAVDNGADAWAFYQQLHPPLVILDVDITRSVASTSVVAFGRRPKRETFSSLRRAGMRGESLPRSTRIYDTSRSVDAVTHPARLAIAGRRWPRRRRADSPKWARAGALAAASEITIALQHEITTAVGAHHLRACALDAADRGERRAEERPRAAPHRRL